MLPKAHTCASLARPMMVIEANQPRTGLLSLIKTLPLTKNQDPHPLTNTLKNENQLSHPKSSIDRNPTMKPKSAGQNQEATSPKRWRLEMSGEQHQESTSESDKTENPSYEETLGSTSCFP
ncbi:Hypothetical predicted protein [Prunus dulcis]|uniref:Uncharacterized protein n=1 Tax=Prunus dulcis TaxID=3755 RepID=A0A5E4EZ21_PRUDU|nr:Hypothetical predicted protein [Prunus dulcis]